MILELIRLEENFDWGTFGVLRINKEVFCVTLEPADLLNAPFVSSIPAQQYKCRRHNSDKYGPTWEIINVPGRSLILFHPGNVIQHTEGCVILASRYGKLKEERAILNSGYTFGMFLEATKYEHELHLTIKEVY